MDKSKIVIERVYESLPDDRYKKNYLLNLYKEDDIDEQRKMLSEIFAYWHYTINELLKDFYVGDFPDRKYIEYSKTNLKILNLINEIYSAEEQLLNSKYEFKLDESYKAYFITIEPFLNDTTSKSIPFDKLTLIDNDKLFILRDKDTHIDACNKLECLFTKISTRNASFSEMKIDEKLEVLNNCIEHLLKINGDYIEINEKDVFGLVTNTQLKKFRNLTHSFRHASNESMKNRSEFNMNKKIFLIDYGVTICNMLTKLKDEGKLV